MTLPRDLLERPAEEAARRIALSFLDEAAAARVRIEKQSDDEALHDFRVGVRRLRSSVRAHGALLPEVDKKRRRNLRALQHATGPARDLEVQISWLGKLAKKNKDRWPALSGDKALDVARLQGVLGERRRLAEVEGVATALRQHTRVAADLRARLSKVSFELDRDPEPYRMIVAGYVREHTDEIVEGIRSVGAIDDHENIHEARIRGKRLRYLVEPLKAYTPLAKGLIRELKVYQDMLGDLRDMHVLTSEVFSQRGESPIVKKAYAALGSRVAEKAATLYADFLVWRDELLPSLEQRMAEMALMLEGKADTEIERKYLLSRLPALADVPGTRVVSLKQGYIPGNAVAERLRSQESSGETKYKRTVKLGEGTTRFEFEESLSARLFNKLWPATEGARIEKRRHKVPAGARVWEVDEFLDRDLVLAEIELESEEEEIVFPEWLAAHVVREVTDDPAYLNLNLAKAKASSVAKPSAKKSPPKKAAPKKAANTTESPAPAKKAAPKKSAAKKSAAKKTSAKKAAPKKSAAKKTSAKKAAPKKSTAKKAAPKKAAPKKSTAKKAPAKKSTAKQTAATKDPAKKASAKKSAAEKTTTKKSASKRRTPKKGATAKGATAKSATAKSATAKSATAKSTTPKSSTETPASVEPSPAVTSSRESTPTASAGANGRPARARSARARRGSPVVQAPAGVTPTKTE